MRPAVVHSAALSLRYHHGDGRLQGRHMDLFMIIYYLMTNILIIYSYDGSTWKEIKDSLSIPWILIVCLSIKKMSEDSF